MKKLIYLIILFFIPISVFAYSAGDVDGNGKVETADYVLVRKHLLKLINLSGEEYQRSDANGDGDITASDYNKIRKTILGLIPINEVTPTTAPIPTTQQEEKQMTAEERICESVKNNASIDYKSFASLQKDNDDYYVIKAAHDCANKYNKPAVATKATYHIYKKNNTSISVQTNTNLNGSTIYIHDEYNDIYKYDDNYVFNIEPDSSNKCKNSRKDNFNNDFSSLVSSSGKYVVLITEVDGIKVFNRNKNNTKTVQEKAKSDIYRVYNGVVQDPMFWDYKNTKIKYTTCPIPSQQLVFQNATIITITKNSCSNCPNSYMRRGIMVTRSNTKIYNIDHSFVDSSLNLIHKINHPYYGFFFAEDVGDLLIQNSEVYALKYGSEGDSTYDISLHNVAGLNLYNVVMNTGDDYNQMKEESNWGVMGTSGCKNFVVEKCKLNRIDAHKGMYYLTVKNSTIGSHGISIVGTGDHNDNKMILENVTWKYTDHLVYLRRDYGATWNGTIEVKNCKVEDATDRKISVVLEKQIEKNTVSSLVFNHPIYNPTKITIDGLSVNSSNVRTIQIYGDKKKNIDYYYLDYFQRSSNKNKSTVISKKNITGDGSRNVIDYAN